MRTDEPYGLESSLTTALGTGLDAFEIRAGYMEMFDIEQLLKDNGIVEKVIFYGIEDIATGNPFWKVFSTLKKLTPNFVQFNKLPAAKLQGVVTTGGDVIMINWILLLIALGIILLGATVFTNGLEWFGKKMKLSDGAVGSIFAAVGTALPETLVPIVAIMFGTPEAGHKIGVGAIIGAPFMLGTLAFFISGLAVMWNRKKRDDYPIMRVDTVVMRRDMEYFHDAVRRGDYQPHSWADIR